MNMQNTRKRRPEQLQQDRNDRHDTEQILDLVKKFPLPRGGPVMPKRSKEWHIPADILPPNRSGW